MKLYAVVDKIAGKVTGYVSGANDHDMIRQLRDIAKDKNCESVSFVKHPEDFKLCGLVSIEEIVDENGYVNFHEDITEYEFDAILGGIVNGKADA